MKFLLIIFLIFIVAYLWHNKIVFRFDTIFRKGFKKAFPNKYLFVILSGVIFGLLHVVSAKTLLEALYIIPYSSLGIAFAITYYKTDTVFSSIFVHILHNSILIIFALFI